MLYQQLIRPLLFALSRQDPEKAHRKVLELLEWVSRRESLLNLLGRQFDVSDPRLHRTVFGLEFPNPVGLAAGFSKDGEGALALAALGFGFLELGTVTPRVQSGNPRPRMFRLPKDRALINRMGFNNQGIEALVRRLYVLSHNSPVPLGISLGKGKDTPLEKANGDYLICLQRTYRWGDYFVVNVSSPNTADLRSLQAKDALISLVQSLQAERQELAKKWRLSKPILLKVAPDLSIEQLNDVLEVCDSLKVDGIIATNTTTSREGLSTSINEVGGLSGAPLFLRALEFVRRIHQCMPNLPIIGVGGIQSEKDAADMFDAGASLVQLYTGLIYEDPSLPRRINKSLLTS